MLLVGGVVLGLFAFLRDGEERRASVSPTFKREGHLAGVIFFTLLTMKSNSRRSRSQDYIQQLQTRVTDLERMFSLSQSGFGTTQQAGPYVMASGVPNCRFPLGTALILLAPLEFSPASHSWPRRW